MTSAAARSMPARATNDDAVLEADHGSQLILHQFESSHFNEKVRWALDWKGIPHVRKSYLPGPHAAKIRALTGQTATPVIEHRGEITFGSARIIERLETDFAGRSLLPEDPAAADRCREIQEQFDHAVGPATRSAMFAVTQYEPRFMTSIFSRRKTALVRWLYRATFPVARTMIRKAYSLDDPKVVDAANRAAEAGFDFVARESSGTGQLVGDDFTLADLCCASLLAPLVGPAHPDMERPKPIPRRVEEYLSRWREHPGHAWVLAQYEKHRPASVAIAA